MADAAASPAVPPAGEGAGAGDAGSDALSAQWQSLMQAYGQAASGKQPALSAGNFVAGTMPLLPLGGFAQPFMYPAPMFYGGVPALHPAYTALMGADGADAKLAGGEGDGGSQDEHSDEEGNEGDKDPESQGKKKGADSRTTSALGKRKSEAGVKNEPGMGVKSQSSAALSLLASAAANKPGQANPAAAAAAAVAAAAQQNISDMWGALNGQPAAAVVSAPDLSRMASDAQMQQLLASGTLDEREAKKLRRKQSNRESARRSRLRKQAECEALAKQVKELIQENSRLKEEKLQLTAQLEIMNHKLSMTSALQMTINQSELDKIQADLRARQTQEAANLAAAMAQVNAITNGTASLGTLGKEGEDPDSEATSDGNQR